MIVDGAVTLSAGQWRQLHEACVALNKLVAGNPSLRERMVTAGQYESLREAGRALSEAAPHSDALS